MDMIPTSQPWKGPLGIPIRLRTVHDFAVLGAAVRSVLERLAKIRSDLLHGNGVEAPFG